MDNLISCKKVLKRERPYVSTSSLYEKMHFGFVSKLHTFGYSKVYHTMAPTINRNYQLYGPGPLARRMGGLATRPPVYSLVVTALQGIVLGLGSAIAWKVAVLDPETKVFEDYYKENPPR
ncbi:hypothetical protein MHU86_21343 [Fragilaria crotonensis]|nr:hypothetical protein MHU86_21343 [Fragilaria crotonensis]